MAVEEPLILLLELVATLLVVVTFFKLSTEEALLAEVVRMLLQEIKVALAKVVLKILLVSLLGTMSE